MINKKLQLVLLNLPIIISIIISYTILYNGGDTANDGTIGIVIALIGVLGTLLGIFLNLKREGNTIKDIKVDTAEMKPEIKYIEKYSSESNEYLTRKFDPLLNTIYTNLSSTSTNINFITEKLKFHEEMKNLHL